MENITGTKISAITNGMRVKNSDRTTLSIMLHDVVFENQRAIFDLVQLRHIGSASALLRVLFEAHIKGVWLYLCATEKQVSQLKKDSIKSTIKPKKSIHLTEMINAIEKEMPHLNGALKKFKENHWKGLNSLTHSGIMQFSYTFSGGKMTKKYSSEYSNSILEFSERFAIMSLGEVGKIAENINIISARPKTL
ncbi:MAG: hypothetical protein GXP17_04730 [Gammaproteobacteria bacterium]|nr:hypothetical protein [Gammaproteobacteria bacterium]